MFNTGQNEEYITYIVNAYYPTNNAGDPGEYVSDEYNKAFKEFAINENGESPLIYLWQNSIDDAPCVVTDSGFPVVVFAPGGGWPVELYSYLFEELASHGYVVLAVTDPLSSPLIQMEDGSIIIPGSVDYSDFFMRSMLGNDADKRMIEYYFNQSNTFDIMNTIHTIGSLNASHPILKGTLSLEDIAVCGHSIGGASAVNAALLDKQIDTVVIYDSYLFHVLDLDAPILEIPSLYLSTEGIEYDEEAKEIVEKQNKEVKSYLDKSHLNTYEVLEGASHAAFMLDLLIGLKQEEAISIEFVSEVDKETIISRIVNETVHFLDKQFYSMN